MKRSLISLSICALPTCLLAPPPAPHAGEYLLAGTIYKVDGSSKQFSIHNLTIVIPGKPEKDAYGDTTFSWGATTRMYSASGSVIKFDSKLIVPGKRVRVICSNGETEVNPARAIIFPAR